MTKPIVYFDVDGVLLDYTLGFFNFCYTYGHTSINPTNALAVQYKYDLMSSDVFRDQQHKDKCMRLFVQHVMENPDALPAYKRIKRELHALKNAGFSLNVLTTGFAEDRKQRVFRVRHLSKLFGPVFDSINFVQHGVRKIDWMMENQPMKSNTAMHDVIVLDDNPAELQAWATHYNPRRSIQFKLLLQRYNKKEANRAKFPCAVDVRDFAVSLLEDQYGW